MACAISGALVYDSGAYADTIPISRPIQANIYYPGAPAGPSTKQAYIGDRYSSHTSANHQGWNGLSCSMRFLFTRFYLGDAPDQPARGTSHSLLGATVC